MRYVYEVPRWGVGHLYMQATKVWFTETEWGSNDTLVSINQDIINLEAGTEGLEEDAEDFKVCDGIKGERKYKVEVSESETALNVPQVQMRIVLTLILRLSICSVMMIKRPWVASMTLVACRSSWFMLWNWVDFI